MKQLLILWILFHAFFEPLLYAKQYPAVFNWETTLETILKRHVEIQKTESQLQMISSKNLPTRWFFTPHISVQSTQPLQKSFFKYQQILSIESQWNLFRWGADLWALKAAQWSEISQSFTIQSTILRAEKEGLEAIFMEIQKIQEVLIYSRMLQEQTELLQIAQKRYQKGLLPIQEIDKLNIDLANVQASLANSKMAEAQARIQLETLLGEPLFEASTENLAHATPDWPWLNFFKQGFCQSMLLLPFDLTKHPEWQSAYFSVQAQHATLHQNWRAFLPSIDTQISVGHYEGISRSFHGWAANVSCSIPLFDQLQNYARVKAQAAQKALSEIHQEKTKRTALNHWETARTNFKTALQTVFTREKALTLSRTLYNDNIKRFEQGKISANDLALDRNRMNSAELFAIQGWSAVHVQWTELCHSLGYRIQSCFKKASILNEKNNIYF